MKSKTSKKRQHVPARNSWSKVQQAFPLMSVEEFEATFADLVEAFGVDNEAFLARGHFNADRLDQLYAGQRRDTSGW